MTCGPYAIIAERAIFLLSEMEDAAERLIFFGRGGRQTRLMQRLSHLTFTLLSEKRLQAFRDPDTERWGL